MVFKMFKRKKKDEVEVRMKEEHAEIGNILLCVIEALNGADGVVGESYIHYMMYRLLNDESFQEYKDKCKFILDGDKPCSRDLHKILEILTRDLSGDVEKAVSGPEIPTIICDTARERYHEIEEAEAWMEKILGKKVTPRIFTLSPQGRGIEGYTREHLLSAAQRDALNQLILEIKYKD